MPAAGLRVCSCGVWRCYQCLCRPVCPATVEWLNTPTASRCNWQCCWFRQGAAALGWTSTTSCRTPTGPSLRTLGCLSSVSRKRQFLTHRIFAGSFFSSAWTSPPVRVMTCQCLVLCKRNWNGTALKWFRCMVNSRCSWLIVIHKTPTNIAIEFQYETTIWCQEQMKCSTKKH
jgi:hypothetical protein